MNLGVILEKTDVFKEFKFTNTGNDPLIISEAAFNDGYSGVTFPKEPIAKGQSGVIRFEYYAKRTGKIDKIIFVNSNASKLPQVLLTIKGDVIYEKAVIKTDSLIRNFGELKFNDVDTAVYTVCNIGSNSLHISYPYYTYPESDLLWLRIAPVKNEKNRDYFTDGYKPDDTLQVIISLKNVYGNTGNFERKFFVLYNSHDTLALKIKGIYTGKPAKQQLIDGYTNWRCIVFNYENDKLTNQKEYDYSGRLYSERFYENSNCIRKKVYDTAKGELTEEDFYKDGVLSDKKVYKTFR